MTLRDHYKSQGEPIHPKRAFIRNLAKCAGVSERAAEAWVLGQRTPSREYWPAIEAFTRTPAAELFPDTTNEPNN